MGKCYLISFVSPNLITAANRFRNQAIESNWFDDIYIYGFDKRLDYFTPDSIKNNFHIEYPRGYGLWAWKSEIINHFINNFCQFDDLVLYLDIGFEFNIKGKPVFQKFLEKVNHDYFLVTRTKKFEFLYSNEILNKILSPSFFLLLTPQYQAGVMFFKCTNKHRTVIKEWDNIVRDNSYEVLTVPGLFEPHLGENRHDQSVFSLLAKRSLKLYTINNPLSFNIKLLEISNYIQVYPFYSMRNYTDNTYIDYNEFIPKKDGLSFLKFIFNRFLVKFKLYKN